jgi:hypothetical protein
VIESLAAAPALHVDGVERSRQYLHYDGASEQVVATMLASMAAAQTQLTSQLADNHALTQSLVAALGLLMFFL